MIIGADGRSGDGHRVLLVRLGYKAPWLVKRRLPSPKNNRSIDVLMVFSGTEGSTTKVKGFQRSSCFFECSLLLDLVCYRASPKPIGPRRAPQENSVRLCLVLVFLEGE